MKIVSRRPLGYQRVYDIGLAQDHNFCLANGTIASNCFNKSHSVAYGYVTYQTAYLKANYPVEYMAALLSSVSGDRDKVQKYIANCLSLGIKVLPPDVNRSGMDFTPIGGNILFGLAAIKNLGIGAIEAILTARENQGKFTSLADLCDRVDSRALNKKSLEALIQAGAMDSIMPNRRQLMQDLEPTLESANRKAREQASGQGSLFDLFSAVPTTISTPPVPDFSPAEKLQQEKELLGFYVSDHPLKEVSNNTRLLTPTNLADLKEVSEASTITAIVLITDIKEITTRKGDRMAIMQIEDLTGAGEAVVFPKVYERLKNLLVKDQRLMLWGKVEQRDEQSQIIVEDLQSIEAVQLLRLELNTEQALNRQELYQLKELLKSQNNGKEEFSKIPIIISLNYGEQLVRLDNQNWIKNAAEMAELLTAKGFTAKLESLVS